jgi:hypothetical protein
VAPICDIRSRHYPSAEETTWPPSFSTRNFYPDHSESRMSVVARERRCPQREHSAFLGCLGVEGGNRPLDLVASAFRACSATVSRCSKVSPQVSHRYSYVGMAPPDRLRFSNYNPRPVEGETARPPAAIDTEPASRKSITQQRRSAPNKYQKRTFLIQRARSVGIERSQVQPRVRSLGYGGRRSGGKYAKLAVF